MNSATASVPLSLEQWCVYNLANASNMSSDSSKKLEKKEPIERTLNVLLTSDYII